MRLSSHHSLMPRQMTNAPSPQKPRSQQPTTAAAHLLFMDPHTHTYPCGPLSCIKVSSWLHGTIVGLNCYKVSPQFTQPKVSINALVTILENVPSNNKSTLSLLCHFWTFENFYTTMKVTTNRSIVSALLVRATQNLQVNSSEKRACLEEMLISHTTYPL